MPLPSACLSTGVVAYNDDIGAEVIGAALRQQLLIPQGLAVVGHDDAPISRLLLPSMTTIRVDTAGLGRYLAALALSAAQGIERPVADGTAIATLIKREST